MLSIKKLLLSSSPAIKRICSPRFPGLLGTAAITHYSGFSKPQYQQNHISILAHKFHTSSIAFQNQGSKTQNTGLLQPSPLPKSLRSNQGEITRDLLLLRASSGWERLIIRTKWFLIKGYRPFNADEISAFFSWFILSHILWIVLGTTTFFSLLFYALNSLFAKEMVGKLTGKLINWLNPNFDIMFQDAVVPEWKSGMIDFKKVKIKSLDETEGLKIDLSIDSIKLTLNFKKWQATKGLIENVEITGLRGAIDTSRANTSALKNEWFSNDNYELERLKIKDSSVQVLAINQDEPITLSIFSCEIPNIRVKWLLLDIFGASSISGSLGDSLFSVHKRQHKFVYVNDVKDDLHPWKRITRFRLDSVDLETIGLHNTQFNWMIGGKVDITADIMPPAEDVEGLVDSSKYVVIDLRLQMSDLKARIPHESPKLTDGEQIISLDDLKPIISYVNNKRLESFEENIANVLPPLKFRVVQKVSDLENVTTFNESKLLDAIATEIYIDLMHHVQEYDVEQRNKKIAMWSKAVASQLLVVGLGAMA